MGYSRYREDCGSLCERRSCFSERGPRRGGKQDAVCEPDPVTGVGHIGVISRVDEQATASLRFPTGAVANLACATQAPAPCMTWEDTLGNMAVLDAWRKAVGLVFDVENGRAGLDAPVVRKI